MDFFQKERRREFDSYCSNPNWNNVNNKVSKWKIFHFQSLNVFFKDNLFFFKIYFSKKISKQKSEIQEKKILKLRNEWWKKSINSCIFLKEELMTSKIVSDSIIKEIKGTRKITNKTIIIDRRDILNPISKG